MINVRIVFVLFILTCLWSCSNQSVFWETERRLKLAKTGYMEIVFPGESEYNVDYLSPNNQRPQGVNSDFRVENARIETESGQIIILESRIPIGGQDPDWRQETDFNDLALDVFDSTIIFVPNENKLKSIEMNSYSKILIQVSNDRVVALYKLGVYRGGYDRYQYMWALYEN